MVGTRSCRLLGCWLCASLCGNEADRESWCRKYPSAIKKGKISKLDVQSLHIFLSQNLGSLQIWPTVVKIFNNIHSVVLGPVWSTGSNLCCVGWFPKTPTPTSYSANLSSLSFISTKPNLCFWSLNPTQQREEWNKIHIAYFFRTHFKFYTIQIS